MRRTFRANPNVQTPGRFFRVKWGLILESMDNLRLMDVVLPAKRGERVIDVRLRTVAKTDKALAMPLSHLGLQLPTGSKRVQNVVEGKACFLPQPVNYQ
jgi:hypothetical protein